METPPLGDRRGSRSKSTAPPRSVKRAAAPERVRSMVMPQPAVRRSVYALLVLSCIAPLLLAACVSEKRQETVTGTFGATSVGCAEKEQLAYHIHTHLTVLTAGKQVAVPGNIGITKACMAFLHTHDQSGIIHVEAPANHAYTLGDFFAVWGQPLSRDRLLDQTGGGEHEVIAYVDGNRVDVAPESIPLTNKSHVVLQYGPPFVEPPPYTFPRGF